MGASCGKASVDVVEKSEHKKLKELNAFELTRYPSKQETFGKSVMLLTKISKIAYTRTRTKVK